MRFFPPPSADGAFGFARKIAGVIRNSDEDQLWKRNLLVLATALFIVMVGIYGCAPFLPLFVKNLGVVDADEAKLWSGMVFAGPFFLSIILVPLWGALGDRYGRKLMVIRAVIGLAIAFLLMGFAQNVYQLLALRLFQGVASGFVAASLAFISTSAPDERSGFAISVLQSSVLTGSIAGPLFGGLLADFFGVRTTFFLVGATCFVSGILCVALLKENFKKGESRISVFSNLKYISKKPEMVLLLALAALCYAGIYYSYPIFPYFLEDLGAPAKYLSTITGSLMGVIGLFNLALAPYWGSKTDKIGYRIPVVIGAAVCGAAFFVHIFVPDYVWLFPIRAVVGVFFSALTPAIYSALGKKSPAEIRGGIMGVASSVSILGVFISYTTCGVVSSQFGMDVVFVISGCLLFLASALAAFCAKPQS